MPVFAEFEHLWRAHDYALAVMSPEMFDQLVTNRLPMQLIARDTERVFVRTASRLTGETRP